MLEVDSHSDLGRIENLSSSVHKMNIETGYDFFTLKVSWYIRLHDLNFFLQI